MKRLRRIIFNGLTLCTLLLCIAIAALWARSGTVEDRLECNRRHLRLGVGTSESLVWIYWESLYKIHPNDVYSWSDEHRHYGLHFSVARPPGDPGSLVLPSAPRTKDIESRWRSYRYYRIDNRSRLGWPSVSHLVVLPLWNLLLPPLFFPVLYAGVRIRERRRYRDGICRVCGYDLRATPDRCPECGTIPARR